MENKLINITASPVESSRVEKEIITSTGYNFNIDVSLTGYGEESIPSSDLFFRPDDITHIVTPSETVSKTYETVFNEQLNKSDETLLLFDKGNSELISTNDLASTLVNFNRVLVDTISTAQETLTLNVTSFRTFLETATNSETKIVNMQDFFESDFVQAGCVGTDITL